MKNILLIAGNGRLAYGEDEIKSAYNSLNNNPNVTGVYLVGNGTDSISLSDIENKISLMERNIPTTIIIYNHGTMRENDFVFCGNSEDIYSRDLYQIIGNYFDRCDIFNTACNSGGSLKDISLLKKDTKVVTLSKETESSYGGQVRELFEQLVNYTGDIDAIALLHFYLMFVVKNRGSIPSIMISGKDARIDLDALFEMKIGDKMNLDKIDSEVTKSLMLSNSEELLSIAKRFSSAKNEYEFSALEYGKALECALLENVGYEITADNIIDCSKSNIGTNSIIDMLNRFRTPELGHRRKF